MHAIRHTHTCVVSSSLFSMPALGLHLISKFILKVCHLSCELLLGFCSGVERGVEIGEKRGREAEGGGADNRGGGRRRAVNEGGGVRCVYVCGTQSLTCFSLLSSSFSYLLCHHPISVPRLLGLFGGISIVNVCVCVCVLCTSSICSHVTAFMDPVLHICMKTHMLY